MSIAGTRIRRILLWIAGILIASILILIVYVQMSWDAAVDRPAPAMTAPSDSATIARGEYIYKYQSLCWGCHYNPAQDATGGPGEFPVPAGGLPFDLSNAGPGFGVWYSRNITPDLETGIGGWSDGEIVQALREGVTKARTTLFPIMPIDWYDRMADDDALAVVAYLRSLPPVHNPVPPRDPSFVAKMLFTFGALKPKTPITDPIMAPPRGITPDYGRYLSSNLGGCADCHTPRNLEDGQFYFDSLFAGSSFAYGEDDDSPVHSYASNITPDPETGIGSWSEEQFIAAVTAGVRPDGTVLTPHMPYALYKFWSEDDLKAVYRYLRTVPALKRTVPASVYIPEVRTAEGAQRGSLLFRARCQGCHGKSGRGAPSTNVSLAEVAPSLTDAEIMEFTGSGQMNLYMPGFGKSVTASELNDIVAYIRTWETRQ